jgi:hypothetical protein
MPPPVAAPPPGGRLVEFSIELVGGSALASAEEANDTSMAFYGDQEQ